MGAGIPSYAIPHDEALEVFFEEELSKVFGICGSAKKCEDLEKAIKEARQRDEEGFRELIRQILKKYINLKKKLLEARILRKVREGPPDRFVELRKRAREIWGGWREYE
ncbi:MAG: hypothetical protein QW764_02930 [Desulfurococcaceae archaeon]